MANGALRISTITHPTVPISTEIPGSGLGLAIAKQLIEQMQGEIQVFSPAINSIIKSPDAPGTTFIIWLPIVEG